MIVVPTQSFLPQLRYFPIKPIQDAYRGLAKLTTFAQVRVTKFMKDCESDPVFAKGTFLRNLVDAVDEETGTKLSAEELVENTLIFLTAGSDTTAITSMYTLWAVARNPRIYHRLTEAIRTAFPDPNVQPTFEQTSKIVRVAHIETRHCCPVKR
jgi:cytochrome P450